MSGLDAIPVKVTQSHDQDMTANVLAILNEIVSLLSRLVETGEPGSIDLRSLPLLPGEYQALQAALGEGEVAASLMVMGPTNIQETAIHGVWWVIHYNSENAAMAEFIEVTALPEILRTHQDDLRDGLAQLQRRLATRMQE